MLEAIYLVELKFEMHKGYVPQSWWVKEMAFQGPDVGGDLTKQRDKNTDVNALNLIVRRLIILKYANKTRKM